MLACTSLVSFYVGLHISCFMLCWRTHPLFRVMLGCTSLVSCYIGLHIPRYMLSACLLYIEPVTSVQVLVFWVQVVVFWVVTPCRVASLQVVWVNGESWRLRINSSFVSTTTVLFPERVLSWKQNYPHYEFEGAHKFRRLFVQCCPLPANPGSHFVFYLCRVWVHIIHGNIRVVPVTDRKNCRHPIIVGQRTLYCRVATSPDSFQILSERLPLSKH
jgi:hypothetical protein